MYYFEGQYWRESFSDKFEVMVGKLRGESLPTKVAKVSIGIGYLMGVMALLPHQSPTLEHNETVTACANVLAEEPKVARYDDTRQACEPFVNSFTTYTSVDENGNMHADLVVPSRQSFMETNYWYTNRDDELANEQARNAGMFLGLGAGIFASQALRRRREAVDFAADVQVTINELTESPEA